MWISNVATFAPTSQNHASVMLLLAIVCWGLRSSGILRTAVEFLGLEDGIDSLYRNVDKRKLPFYAARNSRRAQTSFIPRQKPEITQNKSYQFDVASKF
jgi:hypothetical protein